MSERIRIFDGEGVVQCPWCHGENVPVRSIEVMAEDADYDREAPVSVDAKFPYPGQVRVSLSEEQHRVEEVHASFMVSCLCADCGCDVEFQFSVHEGRTLFSYDYEPSMEEKRKLVPVDLDPDRFVKRVEEFLADQ